MDVVEVCVFLVFFFGMIVMYDWVSRNSFVAKSLGGGVWLEEVGHMVSYVLCEPLPHPPECGEWDGSNVCSRVVKYVHVITFDLDTVVG